MSAVRACVRCGATKLDRPYKARVAWVCPSCLEPLTDLRWRMDQNTIPEPNSGCWLWTGSSSTVGRAAGYGSIWWNGRSARATRAAWFLHTGEWPSLFVCHKCDTPACVNPAHLFLGTNTDNMADMFRKGRGPRRKGSGNPFARLTEEQVRQVVALSSAGQRQCDLADRFGVGRTTIRDVLSGATWSHLTGLARATTEAP